MVRKKHTHLKIIIRFVLLIMPFFGSNIVFGEETLNFHVKPEFPQSQIEGSASYFDLNLNPGETETLVLELQNDKNEAIKVRITPHTAFTNVNGVVEYGKNAVEADPTLIHSLDGLIDPIEPIKLKAKESIKIELKLNMPQKSFEGILAGGLRIEEMKEEQKETDNGEGLAIKNEFSYVIGILVSNSRSTVKPALELLDVFADQVNYRNVFSATLQNFTPTFLNRLEVEATIQREGKDDVLYKTNQNGMQMAPNSNFNFPISLDGARFQSGDYVLKMKARSGNEEWEWTKNFTIEGDEARQLNREDVTIDRALNMK